LNWIVFGPVALRAEFEPTNHSSGRRSNKAGQGISTSQTPDGTIKAGLVQWSFPRNSDGEKLRR